MAIHSFLKAEKGDPDWQFSPEDYFGKEFKIIDANMVEIEEGRADKVVLRQNPTEKDLLAKHLSITLQKNSVLEMTILNDVDAKLQQVFLYDIHLKAGANLSLGMFVKDGMLNKHILQVYLEEGSSFAAYGLISNTVKGDAEIITKIVHGGPDAVSNQLFLGLAGDDSQTVYQSTVIVEAVAQGSLVGIESANLIVGDDAHCHAKPEVYLNAEYCSTAHASETNTISAEKIGYLQSKGIPEEIARELVISSFRNQVISLIHQEAICEEVKEMYVD
jgi:Fe-S cluster assembly protein SufD